METKGLMGGLYKITEWIMRIAGSNLYWIICSSPFLFVVFFKLIYSADPAAQPEVATYWAMAILAPFTLFPATAALFSVTRKWVLGETDLSITKLFFKGYKNNYKQSMLGGIFYTLLIVVMCVDYQVYMKQFKNMQLLGIVMLVLLFFLLLSLFNFFSLVAHFEMKASMLIKNAVLLTVLRPFRTLSTFLCAVLVGFITLKFTWLIPFGFATLIAWMAYFNFNIAYNKVQEKVERLRKLDEEDNEQADGENAGEVDTTPAELPEGEDKEKN
ncbi:YesL family protein [Paenibacillus aceti]|uniref:DUF624 domain-containing protein n=1 Tax=Paenibacillus aceti TaxID=1820010 RepID=A0ABQ1VRR2_9BACL|nr:DUF624 domain-containing protein [Paenibacillus aceti]GGF91599.1 hypothetical protein GCM10010913_11360 [Paenibacillus aceti]